jgi:type IV secretory pathway VirB10-like protein
MLVMLLAMAPMSARIAASQTPTLGELAKKEQERRKGQKTPAKVYTKKDLPPSPPAPPPSGGSTTTAVAADQTKQAEKKPAEDEKDEAWWKNRINQAREEQRRHPTVADALQTRINSLSTDSVNRDPPCPRAKIGADRDKAIAELARVKGDIDRAKKQIEDIEEEARKAGVPPGWLR